MESAYPNSFFDVEHTGNTSEYLAKKSKAGWRRYAFSMLPGMNLFMLMSLVVGAVWLSGVIATPDQCISHQSYSIDSCVEFLN